MNERHAGTVRTRLGSLGQKAVALALESSHIGIDIIGLEAEMMQSTTAFLQVGRNRPLPVHGVNELYLRAFDGQKCRGCGLGRNVFLPRELKAQILNKPLKRGIQVGHRNRNVVQPSDHGLCRNTLGTLRMRQWHAPGALMQEPQWPSQFVAEKPLFNLFGRTYKIFHNDSLSFYVRQKLFRLKETIKVYSDDSMRHIKLEIQARNVIDFSATYDVTDADTHERVGSLARKGFRSMVRDTWTIMNPDGVEIGRIQEDSALIAMIRRLLLNLIPQTFHLTVNNEDAGTIKQRFNLFKQVFDVTLDTERIDPRLGVAASVLLLAIEGRQK